jgi:hypothetical protein
MERERFLEEGFKLFFVLAIEGGGARSAPFTSY